MSEMSMKTPEISAVDNSDSTLPRKVVILLPRDPGSYPATKGPCTTRMQKFRRSYLSSVHFCSKLNNISMRESIRLFWVNP